LPPDLTSSARPAKLAKSTKSGAEFAEDEHPVPSASGGEFEEDERPAPSAPVVLPVDQHRETTRKNLAFCLVALVAILLITVLAKSLWLMKTMQDMTDLLAVLLAPFVGLVGAATGFYYGTKDK